MPQLPRVRAHHVLCLLTYVGRGYSAAFVAAMSELARHVRAGRAIGLVTAPDTLCAVLRAERSFHAAHCEAPRNVRRDRRALRSISRALHGDPTALASASTLTLTPAALAELRHQFAAAGATAVGMRHACVGCEWRPLCSDIAAAGYAGTHLRDTEPHTGRRKGRGA